MSGGKTYVLMVTERKIVKPMLSPAIEQGVIEAMCQFETLPSAVSDDISPGVDNCAWRLKDVCDRIREALGVEND